MFDAKMLKRLVGETVDKDVDDTVEMAFALAFFVSVEPQVKGVIEN